MKMEAGGVGAGRAEGLREVESSIVRAMGAQERRWRRKESGCQRRRQAWVSFVRHLPPVASTV